MRRHGGRVDKRGKGREGMTDAEKYDGHLAAGMSYAVSALVELGRPGVKGLEAVQRLQQKLTATHLLESGVYFMRGAVKGGRP